MKVSGEIEKHRAAVERIIDQVDMPDFLRDALMAHFDHAVGIGNIELCKMRNRVSGMVARLEGIRVAA